MVTLHQQLQPIRPVLLKLLALNCKQVLCGWFVQLQDQPRFELNTMLTESQEQQLVIQWADLIPQISGRLLAIPNGANKSMTARMRFKREGLRPGVPDLFLPIPNKHYHGLWIEMKRMKGSTTSLQQHDWIEFLQEQNYQATICRGADEAIAVIQEYLSSVFEINYWQDL